jgi:acyl-CoA thioesterase FadM
MASRPKNPADLIVRSRLREEIHFPDLTERLALRLSAVLDYTARAHFAAWHKRLGGPDGAIHPGLPPLFHVDIEVTDVPVESAQRLPRAGRDVPRQDGRRDRRHASSRARGPPRCARDASKAVIAKARLLNVFTRYDADPVRRRVTELPPTLNLAAPSRLTELPDIGSLVPADRRPDFVEDTTRVWHYGQTDANRHVNSMEYLRSMELYIADVLHAAGHDLKRLYFARARVVYRKPCFRGEGYRRLAWFRGEAPFVIAGAIVKDGDMRPAAAVELTLGQHEAREP